MSSLLKPVQSSAIHAYAVSNDKTKVAIQFKASNVVYVYFNVSQKDAKGFDQAKSKGKFAGRFTKGTYQTVSMSPEEFEKDYRDDFTPIAAFNLMSAVTPQPGMDFRL